MVFAEIGFVVVVAKIPSLEFDRLSQRVISISLFKSLMIVSVVQYLLQSGGSIAVEAAPAVVKPSLI